jgi:hypothetical protein
VPEGAIRLAAAQRLYAVGRGFTTASGDAYRVVAKEVQTTPNDALARVGYDYGVTVPWRPRRARLVA